MSSLSPFRPRILLGVFLLSILTISMLDMLSSISFLVWDGDPLFSYPSNVIVFVILILLRGLIAFLATNRILRTHSSLKWYLVCSTIFGPSLITTFIIVGWGSINYWVGLAWLVPFLPYEAVQVLSILSATLLLEFSRFFILLWLRSMSLSQTGGT